MFRTLGAAIAVCLMLSPMAAKAADESSIPPGTIITLANWRQYKQFMPQGMQVLFEGRYFWKMPADFRMEVGASHNYPLPEEYVRNTQKYSHLVRIKETPGGGHTITGYVAGSPFPNPSEPQKGYKILVDFWYRSIPYLYCGTDDYQYLINSAHQVTSARYEDVFRRLSHISDSTQPITDPRAQGIDYSQFSMVLAPEQQRYTAFLTIYYIDPAKAEDVYIFVPQLRRVLRGSTNSRCAPVAGSDFTPDDFTGFSGGIARFQAEYLRDQRILTLTNSDPHRYGQLANYYPLYFPKPEVGKWETRDTYVIDTRRISSQKSGYCYGKQIMYVDKSTFVIFWKDIYDPHMKLFKLQMANRFATPVPREGLQLSNGNAIEIMWNLDTAHMSAFMTAGPDGRGQFSNEECRNLDGVNYDDIARYSMPSGLTQVMR
jgi:hypothetical protein